MPIYSQKSQSLNVKIQTQESSNFILDDPI